MLTLPCQACGALLRSKDLRIDAGEAVCPCGARIPLERLERRPVGEIRQRCRVSVNWVPDREVEGGYAVHVNAEDCKTVLSPWVTVASLGVFRKLLGYLSANAEELEDFDYCMEQWGQGSAFITLEPHRKNLLRDIVLGASLFERVFNLNAALNACSR